LIGYERAVTYFRVSISLLNGKEKYENFSQDSWYPGSDPNLVPPSPIASQ
jgi:hypothetical protein